MIPSSLESSLHLSPERSRCEAHQFTEEGCKVALARKPRLQGDVRDWQIRLRQQFLRAFDSLSDNVVDRTQSHRFFEDTREVVTAHSNFPRYYIERDAVLPLEVLANELKRSSQFMRRHPALPDAHIFQTAIAPHELNGEHRCNRIRIQPSNDVFCLQLIEQRHRHMTELFISYGNLRLDRQFTVIQATAHSGPFHEIRLKVYVQRFVASAVAPTPTGRHTCGNDCYISGCQEIIEGMPVDVRLDVDRRLELDDHAVAI